MHNQHLGRAVMEKPAEVVAWMGAMQAQDYPGAKWAIAQRSAGVTDAGIDQAFAEGSILRTHILRPTWHFVTPANIRWILQLSAPRVNALNATYYRRLGLDEAVFARSRAALVKALQGGKQLPRAEIASVLQGAGIATHGPLRLPYILMRAELDGIICSGARQGRQFTYALLDERAPQTAELEREAAVAELVRRYFASRGPATLKDFAWWSGLTIADGRAGVEMNRSQLLQEVVGGETYWFPDTLPITTGPEPVAHFLSTYDECLIGYKDRNAWIEQVHAQRIMSQETFTSTILLDGRVVGVWRRTLGKRAVAIEMILFTALGEAETRAVAAAAEAYGAFLGLPVLLERVYRE
jgi:hypothetical protein